MIDTAEMETKAIRYARWDCGQVLLEEKILEELHYVADMAQAIDHVVAACIVGFREGLRRQRLEQSAPDSEIRLVRSDA